jgi:hypothetical protein
MVASGLVKALETRSLYVGAPFPFSEGIDTYTFFLPTYAPGNTSEFCGVVLALWQLRILWRLLTH